MNKSKISALVREHDGHFYDYDEDGVLLLDKTSKRIMHLANSENAEDIERQVPDVLDFFSKIDEPQTEGDSPAPTLPCVFVDVECCYIEDHQTLENILADIVPLLKEHSVYLRIHFDIPKPSWSDFFRHFIECCVNTFKENHPVFHLCGTFAPISEADKEFLFVHNFRLFYVHDIASADTPFSTLDQQIITDVAEYGFRMPLLWCVQEKNIDILPEIIEEAMKLNYHAGFALPPVQDSIFPTTDAMPSFECYLSLLINVYQKHPHYDEVLIPLNTLLKKNLSGSFIGGENQNYHIDQASRHLKRIESDDFHVRTKDFWHKAFLWQRWAVVDTLPKNALTKHTLTKSE